MQTFVFLGIRALHVGLAALWMGSTVFTSVMLVPVIDASGPSGGQIMAGLTRRGIIAYMTVLSVTTMLTGVFLLWRFTGGFDGSVIATHAGIAFGTGGIAGILAGIVGGAVVGRSAGKVATIVGKAASLPDGQARGALMEQATKLRRRMKTGSRTRHRTAGHRARSHGRGPLRLSESQGSRVAARATARSVG